MPQAPVFGYSTCTTSISQCNDGVCDHLERMHQAICPQDCVQKGKYDCHILRYKYSAYFVDKIRMAIKLNIPLSGRGILSTKSDNMTCACDSTSCQCFHAKFHLTELDGNIKMKISPSCEYMLTLPSLLTCISVVVCDDHCVLAVSLTFGLSFLVCLLVCLAWRKR